MSYEDICSFGCSLAGELELKLTPALIAVWYEEEKAEREASTPEGAKSRSKDE